MAFGHPLPEGEGKEVLQSLEKFEQMLLDDPKFLIKF